MSTNSFHTIGIGVASGSIHADLNKVITAANEFADLKESIDRLNLPEDPTVSDFGNYVNQDDCQTGIAGLIADILMFKTPGLQLDVPYSDDDGDFYIVYCPKYAWNMTEFDDQFQTQDEVEEFLVSEFNDLSSENIDPDSVGWVEVETIS